MSIRKRKLEHVEVVLFENVGGIATNMLKDVTLIHQAIPDLTSSSIDTSQYFLGKKLSYPFMITGMTGGSQELIRINGILASVAEYFNVAMGVGSQRVALEHEDARESFRVVREKAPSIPIVGNIGYPQINAYSVEQIRRLVEMIDADGLAIHLNAGQEVFQPEGEPEYLYQSLTKALDLAREVGIPLIVKETGCGISMETASLLKKAGVNVIDISGSGGTSWVSVEMERSRRKNKQLWEAAIPFQSWGIPTAASIIETRYSYENSFIIASGGINNGLEIAKSIALGANIGGMAASVLKYAIKGEEHLKHYLSVTFHQIKAAMFLTGSKDVNQLRNAPIVITGELRQWIDSRGIELLRFSKSKGLNETSWH